jgi:DNA end-binding protein Ku
MRAIWKGSISFGLINIPIALYPATQREELKFRLLRASDLSPVNYKRVAAADGKEVPWEQIVKGYEYEKDKFIVLKEEDFKRVDVEATQTVEIMDFVLLREINPILFNKPYYMEPQKGGQRAYVLLRDALAASNKVGIAKVVIKTREHLAAVKANDSGLMLELLHFADELIDAKELHLPAETKVRKGEMEMAKELIEKMTIKWESARYHDEYKAAVMKLIEAKVEKGEAGLPRAKKPRRATNVIDLTEILRKSLGAKSKKSTVRKSKRKHPGKHLKAAA